MSKKVLYLLGILLTIIVGAIVYWYYCCDYGVKSRKKDATPANSSLVAIQPDKTTPLSDAAIDSVQFINKQAAKEKLNAQPLILFFQTNKSVASLNQEGKQKLDEIRDYFKKHPDDGILITGHTDNIGNPDYNIRLGQARADFVKTELVRNGIIENNITSISKGFNEPIADNTTSEGRAKNRRAILLIK